METYTIGQVARLLNITVETIRYYDQEELLPFVKRDSVGRRIFTEDNVQLLQMILDLRQAGVPVKEIAHFVSWRLDGDDSLGERYAFLNAHESVLEDKIRQLEQSLAYLRFKKWYYKTAQEAGTEQIHLEKDSKQVAPETYERYQKLLDDGADPKKIGNFE